jgi:hypothetical protein
LKEKTEGIQNGKEGEDGEKSSVVSVLETKFLRRKR